MGRRAVRQAGHRCIESVQLALLERDFGEQFVPFGNRRNSGHERPQVYVVQLHNSGFALQQDAKMAGVRRRAKAEHLIVSEMLRNNRRVVTVMRWNFGFDRYVVRSLSAATTDQQSSTNNRPRGCRLL